MKKLSRFDLGMIIAFVLIALIGAGAWWYLSGDLQSAVADTATASQDFDKFSSGQVYLPTNSNVKVLQTNIDLIHAQLDPLIKKKLQSPDSKLANIANQDTVAWKRDLVKEATTLNAQAHQHGVTLPDNYYFGFSRYLNSNPPEAATLVLDKQLLAIDQITNILINAPVKSIKSVRRSYEEDAPGTSSPGLKPDGDRLVGSSLQSPGGVYTTYPFEVDFDATTDELRKILNDLVQSPYVFVVRTLTIQNSRQDSPQIDDLDKYAPPATNPVDSSPGESAAAKSTAGPMLLFGGEILHVHLRIDLIEWNGMFKGPPPAAGGRPHRNGPGGA